MSYKSLSRGQYSAEFWADYEMYRALGKIPINFLDFAVLRKVGRKKYVDNVRRSRGRFYKNIL